MHVDIDCLDIIWDRDNRDDGEREAITLAHMGRELTDIYAFHAMRTNSLLKLYDIDNSVLPKYLKSKKSIIDRISALDREWQNFYQEHYLDKDD